MPPMRQPSREPEPTLLATREISAPLPPDSCLDLATVYSRANDRNGSDPVRANLPRTGRSCASMAALNVVFLTLSE